MMNPAELAVAANENLAAHFTWVQSRTAGMQVRVGDDLVVTDCGLPCDTFNAICRARLESQNATQRIHAALDYFHTVQRPFSWWVNPGDQPANLSELLRDAGLQEAETELAMAADLSKLRIGDTAPHGLQIRRVYVESQLRDFATIMAANWTPPDLLVNRFYERAAPVLLSAESPLWFYVGYLDDVPVAGAELTVGDGCVGLYSICTLTAYRGRGFGSALTLQPLVDARSAGHHTAILQAAVAGVNIYRRIGFESFGEITEYKPLADSF